MILVILVIDNYDSFTYNLVQYLRELGEEVRVFRNDAVTVEALESLAPKAFVVSPGPGRPEEAGVTLDVIRRLAPRVPMLGVCLGHQALAYACGARIVRAERLMHGKASPISHRGVGVLGGLPSPFSVGRYHSLVVDPATLPSDLEVTAWAGEGEIMALRHRRWPAQGVQFHPESILSEHGHALLRNFLRGS